jgi:hypothetical protein
MNATEVANNGQITGGLTAVASRQETAKLPGWNRPPTMEPDGEGELLELAMGPHHPSTHGVFRMDVVLDG